MFSTDALGIKFFFKDMEFIFFATTTTTTGVTHLMSSNVIMLIFQINLEYGSIRQLVAYLVLFIHRDQQPAYDYFFYDLEATFLYN